MKNQIARAVFIIIVLIGLNEFGILNAFIMFLLVGAVPGTDYSVPSSFMLTIMIISLWLIFYKFTAVKALNRHTANKWLKRANAHKKRMPRRRFSEI